MINFIIKYYYCDCTVYGIYCREQPLFCSTDFYSIFSCRAKDYGKTVSVVNIFYFSITFLTAFVTLTILTQHLCDDLIVIN